MAQRQFRSDDTSIWADKYGTGSDGALTISSNTIDAPVNSACTGTSSSSSLSATNGSFAGGQLLLIHQTRGTGAGNWEFNKINSYVAGTITTIYPLINTYGSGAQVQVLKQYSAVTINGGSTLTASAWDGSKGGILGWFCNGSTTNSGAITLNGNNGSNGGTSAGIGFVGGNPLKQSGGTASAGEGTAGASVNQTGANGNGGGGGGGASSGNGSGAGGGGNGTGGGGGNTSDGSGTGGAFGATAGSADLTSMVFGGGGGGAQQGASDSDENGGGGSGAGIFVAISEIFDTSGGTITLTGGNGGARTDTFANGGGGGAGGSALIKGMSVTLGTTVLTASGGAHGGFSNRSGGNGGVGRIHVDYLSTLSGTTTPTLDSRQDTSLSPQAGGAAIFALL